MSINLLTIAVGAERFHRQAENLALSVRIHHPDARLGVVSDQLSRHSSLFDEVVQADLSRGVGVLQKLYLYDYSPFDETLFIDSDSLLTAPMASEHLEGLRKHHFAPVCERFLSRGESDPCVSDLSTAMAALGVDYYPKFNGGIYFFRKHEEAKELFEAAEAIYRRRGELGILDFDRAGPNEETLFALAMAELGLRGYDDRGELMRTPIGMTGRLATHPYKGTAFTKAGRVVRPAILHFTGDPWRWPEYRASVPLVRRSGILRYASWTFGPLLVWARLQDKFADGTSRARAFPRRAAKGVLRRLGR